MYTRVNISPSEQKDQPKWVGINYRLILTVMSRKHHPSAHFMSHCLILCSVVLSERIKLLCLSPDLYWVARTGAEVSRIWNCVKDALKQELLRTAVTGIWARTGAVSQPVSLSIKYWSVPFKRAGVFTKWFSSKYLCLPVWFYEHRKQTGWYLSTGKRTMPLALH